MASDAARGDRGNLAPSCGYRKCNYCSSNGKRCPLPDRCQRADHAKHGVRYNPTAAIFSPCTQLLASYPPTLPPTPCANRTIASAEGSVNPSQAAPTHPDRAILRRVPPGCSQGRAGTDTGSVPSPAKDLMREHGVLRRNLIVYGELSQRLRANSGNNDPARPTCDRRSIRLARPHAGK